MKFEIYKKLVYRAPGFSWSAFESQIDNEAWLDILSSDEIVDAISYSAPGFVQRCLAKKENLPADQKLALIQFLIRMSTRSTPFGAFAGVGVGQVGSENVFPEYFRNTKTVHSVDITNKFESDRLVLNPTHFELGELLRYDVIGRQRTGSPSDKPGTRILQVSRLKRLIAWANQGPFTHAQAVSQLRKLAKLDKKTAGKIVNSLVEASLFVHPLRSVQDLRVKEAHEQKEAEQSDFTNMSGLTFGKPMQLAQKDARKIISACLRVSHIGLRQKHESPLLRAVKKFLIENSPETPLPLVALNEKLISTYMDATTSGESVDRVRLLQQSLQRIRDMGEEEWKLSDQDLESLRTPEAQAAVKVRELPFSVLVGAIPESGREWRYVIRAVCNVSATRMFSRYGDFLPEIAQMTADVQKLEQQSGGPGIVADLQHISHANNSGRLLNRSISYENFIDCSGIVSGSAQRIPISDLAFRLSAMQELEVIVARTGERVFPQLSHVMRIFKSDSIYYRMLFDLAHVNSWAPVWDWGSLQEQTGRFPRISISGITLAPQVWIFYAKSEDEVVRQLKNLKVPERVYLIEDGLRMFLNLSKSWGKAVLLSRIGKYAKFILEEVREGEEYTGIEANLVALPIVESASVQMRRQSLVKDPRESFIPGDEFLYFKLYCNPELANFILAKLSAFSERENRLWFFIKYSENGFHIRLRFQCKEQKQRAQIFQKISKICRELRKDKVLYRVEMGTYQRELRRYGGEKGVELFEKISWHDSCLFLRYLKVAASMHLNILRPQMVNLGGLLIDHWLAFYFPTVPEREAFVRSMAYGASGAYGGKAKTGRARIEKMDQVVPAFFCKFAKDDSDEKSRLKAQFSKLAEKLSRWEKMNFIASAIHMSLNRFFCELQIDDREFYRACHSHYESRKKN